MFMKTLQSFIQNICFNSPFFCGIAILPGMCTRRERTQPFSRAFHARFPFFLSRILSSINRPPRPAWGWVMDLCKCVIAAGWWCTLTARTRSTHKSQISAKFYPCVSFFFILSENCCNFHHSELRPHVLWMQQCFETTPTIIVYCMAWIVKIHPDKRSFHVSRKYSRWKWDFDSFVRCG